ncbi:GMC oxidoreductase-like protein [Lineolata rhizophorae]|uniref:GMC oxidoreductase-like protein n=1 Tax=Lineolata rhizophorae TaxID=578093 RepID=A0A6A6NZQ0_9PEZI|nr:GMC oxidoreductase-like protein [Lineolata rhizophorae]
MARLASLLLALNVALISAYPHSVHYTTLVDRQSVADEYDYVIVGGGTAGLTVGDRLTEDSDYTVLVIENGGEPGENPAAMSSNLMYDINSEPQQELNGRTFQVGIGNCVGGSSAVNGQVFLRGTKEEYDIWAELGGEGSTWNWEGLLPYFIKGIHLIEPDQQLAQAYNITYDLEYWGQESNIYAVFSPQAQPELKFFYDAYKVFPGVDVPVDSGSGENGLYWYTASMEPQSYIRSYAKTGHWDGINRSNYQLITNSKVNKILFDGDVATGVQFGSQTVSARKEVILAAGSVHTPQVLQLSGIGPSSLLSQAGIEVKVDLPGVGANFQDHSYIPSIYYQWGNQPQMPNVPGSGGGVGGAGAGHPMLGAFLGLPVITPDRFEEIASAFETQDPAQYLPSGIDSAVVEGYAQQQAALSRAMRSKDVTFLEQMVTGQPGGSVQNLHPSSRGTIYINPSNPEAEPIVDYRAGSNPVDIDVMVELVKFMRRFMTTGELAQYNAQELMPGSQAQSDSQLADWVRGQINPSVFHPIGTTAKMPREWGGVVSEDLFVYGVENLSVIDAGIMPTTVGATTSMTVYAIAEKAADIIKARQ